jgi:hypothetical protein
MLAAFCDGFNLVLRRCIPPPGKHIIANVVHLCGFTPEDEALQET